MLQLRRLIRQRWFRYLIGTMAAYYLRLVWYTNRFTLQPPNIIGAMEPMLPAIVVFWHGQHFMMPFLLYRYWRRSDRQRATLPPARYQAKVLISRHRDGDINAIAAESLGVGMVRGSGDHGGEFHRKGGVAAFKEMVAALADGYNMALTADVPKISRVAGLGVIMLARLSGRPILPVAMTTSRFIRLKNWDRSTINLPLGRGVALAGEPLHVPADADADQMETLRLELERRLNDANRRAYALLGIDEETGHAA